MKIATVALTAATASVALAQPHNHNHKHRHGRHAQRDVTVTTDVPGPTAYAYILDGQNINVSAVCDGLANHQLKFADGNTPSGICGGASSTSAPSTTATPTTTQAAEFYLQSSSSSAPASSSSAAASVGGATGIDAPFPDGQLDCSTFPSSYGAVSLPYLGLGGWSGLQAVAIAGSVVNSIVTGVSGQSCTEGMMCSYACPPGYQKSQWPSAQGATGQSVGGISCSGGKLYLTNPGLSKTLCIRGTGGVFAQNKASGVVAICRTDYPGTESETVPVELQSGVTSELTCPSADSYYQWQGKGTSAQYYLNPIGTSAAVGCQWGSPGGNVGNYAPINLGVGFSNGLTWLSIFQNAPTTTAAYQGTVEIVGSGIVGACKYSNGQYCAGSSCNSQGCTVSVAQGGTATYVVSE